VRLAVILVVAACGGHAAAPPPPKPAPLDARTLAKQLDEDLIELGEIAHRLRGKCRELIAELRPHVARMQQHHASVTLMLEDATQAADLERELASYAKHAAGTANGIADDLGATYLTCHDCTTDAACKERYQLEHVIADMPTY